MCQEGSSRLCPVMALLTGLPPVLHPGSGSELDKHLLKMTSNLSQAALLGQEAWPRPSRTPLSSFLFQLPMAAGHVTTHKWSSLKVQPHVTQCTWIPWPRPDTMLQSKKVSNKFCDEKMRW